MSRCRRCCHRAATVALCAAADTAAAAAPPPSCHRRRAFALPPPPQLPRCCHCAAATALPPPRCRRRAVRRRCRRAAADLALSRCRHRRRRRRRTAVCWLVVALLSTNQFRHCMLSCDYQRSRCRPLSPINFLPPPPPPPPPLPPGRHNRHPHCRGQTHHRTLAKKEAAAPPLPAYQLPHHHEHVYESRQLKTFRIETYTSRFGGTIFSQPDRPCFFSEPWREKHKTKIRHMEPGQYDGRQRLWLFLLPVGRPRPFCSRASDYRAMGDAPYCRRHENRAGGSV